LRLDLGGFEVEGVEGVDFGFVGRDGVNWVERIVSE